MQDNIVDHFKKMKGFPLLKTANTLIVNADSGFDFNSFVECCFEHNVIANIRRVAIKIICLFSINLRVI